jgi:hypothetical protein
VPAARRRPIFLAAAPAALLAAAVAEAALFDGGFSAESRVGFAVAALVALVAAVVLDRRAASDVARQPAVVVLGVLAGVGALSALWTAGFPADSLRWAAVTAGFAAVAVCAGVAAARPWGVRALAAGICVLALVGGVVGLVAAATFTGPFADRVGGAWRPGGTLEYSSALALLQVSAVPALLAAMFRAPRLVGAGAACACAAAAATVALAGSRLQLAMALAVGAATVAWPERTVRAPRAVAASAVALAVAAGACAWLVAGGYVAPDAEPGAARALGLGVVCVAAALIWAAGRVLAPRSASGMPGRLAPPGRLGTPGRLGATRRRIGAATAAAVVLAAAAVAIATAGGAPTGPGIEPAAGLDHGRLATWRAALDTAAERPLHGAGADAFLVASADHQPGGAVVRFAHSLPLELAAELGIAGLLLALALYAGAARALRAARSTEAAWLLGPAVVAFLVASLVDWPWHLAGAGAIWAAALGGVLGAGRYIAGARARLGHD